MTTDAGNHSTHGAVQQAALIGPSPARATSSPTALLACADASMVRFTRECDWSDHVVLPAALPPGGRGPWSRAILN